MAPNSGLEIGTKVGTEVGTASKLFGYDEAVELTGHGLYNRLVLGTCSVVSVASCMDMFGFGLLVAASSCDLQLELTETGALASAPFIGLLFALPWGYYADTRGRRKTLLLSTSCAFLLAAAGSLSPNWQTMLVLKIISAIFSSTALTISMTYLGECTPSRYRSRYMFIMNSFTLITESTAFLIAYFILPLNLTVSLPWLGPYRPWRLLALLMAVPLGVGAIMVACHYESPKFLANSGEGVKALNVLRKMYEINGGKFGEYKVQYLATNEPLQCSATMDSIVKQTVPIFRQPYLLRTMQLFYLMVICCSVNNVFIMWFPTVVNSFFTSKATGGFCPSVVNSILSNQMRNVTVGLDQPCNDTISPYTIYSGIVFGIAFMIVNLAITVVAAWRRLVLIGVFLVSAVSSVLVDVLTEPIWSLLAFALVHVTCIGIGVVGSYFVDLYPTSYRAVATSLGMMVARAMSFTGVNIMGAVILNYCRWTFYSSAIVVFSGVGIALLLPADRRLDEK